MNIDLHKITIRKVIAGYKDSAEEGVVAYEGKLDVRPKYQREFVYKPEQREEYYWLKRNPKIDFPKIVFWVNIFGLCDALGWNFYCFNYWAVSSAFMNLGY